jgi:gliding-associated putative ABC transporter substrate-binding component GldG
MKFNSKQVISIIIFLLVVNVLSFFNSHRLDFTSDSRYTLSEISKSVINAVDQPMQITVYLKGNLNGEFRRLQRETAFLLDEINIENREISYRFINPVENGEDEQQVGNLFYQSGMMPENITERKNGKLTKSTIFPWAVLQYQGKEQKVHLLNKKLNIPVDEMISSSIQNLEYAFTDAITKLTRSRNKKVAVLRSNAELKDDYIADFLESVNDYYLIAPFSLDSVASQPQKVFNELKKFDAIIAAKPQEAFTDEEVYVLDQYIMNGGKALWMVESVAIEKDSLKQNGSTVALPRDLNLLNLFFKYGVRINYEIINDIYSAPIYLTTGSAENTQLNPYPWFYEPLVQPQNNHPITSNLNAVKFEFANKLDTLRNGIDKTVLLQSSPSSRAEGTPREVSLDIINSRPTPEMYPEGNYPLAVLLEGKFTSVYKNRITPIDLKGHIDEGKVTAQIVISDGDIVRNDVQRGVPLSLGFDRFTGDTYGNKTFLINSMNYLLGDIELLALRNRVINIPHLDDEKILENGLLWQFLNIVLGIVVIIGFSFIILWYRKSRLR